MAESAPGRVIAGRYRLRAIIGSGGMGAVWRAHDELLNRDVAVKEIVWPPEMNPDERETARRRAVREAQLAARLDHPNVVAVYDIVEEDGRPSIVMALLPHRSLRDAVLEDGPLSPAQAARVGLGVLAALEAAHRAGVTHRDVKPANILLGPEDRVILTDFGIAKAVDSPALTTSGVLVGSPSYTAPERARGEKAGPAADLWALGASLYTAVEGRPPFDRNGALASLTAVVSDEPDPPANAGPLWPVISGLLRKDPDTRLGIAEAARMLSRIADGTDREPVAGQETVQAPIWEGGRVQPEELAVVRPRRRSHYRAAFAALGLIVAAVGAAAVALLATRSPGHSMPPGALKPSAGTHTAARARGTRSPGAASSSAGHSAAPGNGSAPGATASKVPPGYYRFTNSTGFSIAVPSGWQISHVGHYVYIRDPGNGGIFLLIDQSDQPKPDPLADWRQQEANRESTYPGYHRILLQGVRYPQAEKAADWEFTYVRDGVPVQILNRNILANAHHAYALYWSTPMSDWNAYYHYFEVFAATFQPAS